MIPFPISWRVTTDRIAAGRCVTVIRIVVRGGGLRIAVVTGIHFARRRHLLIIVRVSVGVNGVRLITARIFLLLEKTKSRSSIQLWKSWCPL